MSLCVCACVNACVCLCFHQLTFSFSTSFNNTFQRRTSDFRCGSVRDFKTCVGKYSCDLINEKVNVSSAYCRENAWHSFTTTFPANRLISLRVQENPFLPNLSDTGKEKTKLAHVRSTFTEKTKNPMRHQAGIQPTTPGGERRVLYHFITRLGSNPRPQQFRAGALPLHHQTGIEPTTSEMKGECFTIGFNVLLFSGV